MIISMKKKFQICGRSGNPQQDPSLYSEEEQKKAELVDCGCGQEQEQHRVTRDMAIDAGDLSLEGTLI